MVQPFIGKPVQVLVIGSVQLSSKDGRLEEVDNYGVRVSEQGIETFYPWSAVREIQPQSEDEKR